MWLKNILAILAAIGVFLRGRIDAALEALALRDQVAVLRRKTTAAVVPKKPSRRFRGTHVGLYGQGRWAASSLHKQRELESEASRFMSDAATAYTVVVLGDAR